MFLNVPSSLVDPQLVRLAVVGDVDVEPTVGVEIGGDDTPSAGPNSRDRPAAAVTSVNVPLRLL